MKKKSILDKIFTWSVTPIVAIGLVCSLYYDVVLSSISFHAMIWTYGALLLLASLFILGAGLIRFLHRTMSDSLEESTLSSFEEMEFQIYDMYLKMPFIKRALMFISSIVIMYVSVLQGFFVLAILEAFTEAFNITEYIRSKELRKDEGFQKLFWAWKTSDQKENNS